MSNENYHEEDTNIIPEESDERVEEGEEIK